MDYDVILLQYISLRRPHIAYSGVSTLQMVTYLYYNQAVLKRVLVDQRVPGYVTRSKTIRVLGSIP